MANRRKFLLSGIAALALLSGQAKATIPLTMVDNGIGIPGGTTFLGAGQAQSNSISLKGLVATWGAPLAPGDLALYYGTVNTSSTSSGIQGIAAGPTGWTTLSGAGVVQFGTSPVFVTRGIWWRVLTQADIDGDTVSFTPGSLAVASACGIMIFRGATTPALVSSTSSTSGLTHANASNPSTVSLNGEKLAVLLITFRADLAETITAPSVWQDPVAGVKFAGDFYFADPTTYANSIASTVSAISWTTASPYSVLWIKWT